MLNIKNLHVDLEDEDKTILKGVDPAPVAPIKEFKARISQ